MAPTVAAQWANSASVPGTFGAQPGIQSLPVPVANTAGDWMVAICAWRQYPFGQPVSVSVADDAHNWWEPLGAPAADSDSTGVTRISAWAAPAARAAGMVMLAPTGPCAALAMIVLDVAGMLPWLQLASFITGAAPAATSLGLAIPAPIGGANSFALTAAATDLSTATISFTGSGWTALTGTSATNGTDHTGDLELAARYRPVISASQAVTWSPSAACDIAGIGVAAVSHPAAPQLPNPNWPEVITEIAVGAGPSTPPAQLNWVQASARSLGLSIATQGASYLLGGLQAAQGALSLDNPDMALLPPGQGPYSGIDSGTPVRVRAIWPPATSPHNVVFNGFFRKFPHGLDPGLRGQLQATLTDAFGYANKGLQSILRTTLLGDSPFAVWPLADAAGSQFAAQIVSGGPGPLAKVLSKYGAGGASAAFGASPPNPLTGDSSSTCWQQSLGTGTANTTNGYANCLAIALPAPLDITGGATVEIWFQLTAGFGSLNFDPVLWVIKDGRGPVLQISIDQGNGKLKLTSWSTTGTPSTVTLFSPAVQYPGSQLTYLMAAFSPAGYTVFDEITGTSVTGTFAAPLRGAVSLLSFGGQADRDSTGGMWSGNLAFAAVYPYQLTVNQRYTHQQAGYNALAGAAESASQRIERILQLGGVTGRRCILPETGQDIDVMASAADTGGAAQATVTTGGALVAAPPAQGSPAASALQNVAASTYPAVLAVAPTGDFWYLAKQYAYNQAIKWVLGDNFAGGEIPYLGDAVFPYDPADVANDIQITQEDTQAITVPQVDESGSVAQYGDQSYQATGYLENDASSGYSAGPGLQDLANWIACARAQPQLRAQVTISAAAHPAAWPFVLGASAGDIVTVNARPPTSKATISVTARIIQLQGRTLAFSPDGVTGSVQVVLGYAPEHLCLTADDPARGQLDGVNVLGW